MTMENQFPDTYYKTDNQKRWFEGENITGLSDCQLEIKDNYLLN
jgi:hypothetical protein